MLWTFKALNQFYIVRLISLAFQDYYLSHYMVSMSEYTMKIL